MKSKNGFSLLELSISLIVISIVTTAVLALIPVIYKMRDARLTAERLKVLDNAIKAYILKHEKLPLPADIKLTPSHTKFGREVSSTSDLKTIKNTIYVGTVPVFDLGLSSQYMTDGYGNKFVYQVKKTCCGDEQVFNCAKESSDNITLQIDDKSQDVVYAIISNGPNRIGAFSLTKDYSDNIKSNILVEEKSNTYKYADDVYHTVNTSRSFDDMVLYSDGDVLVSKLGLQYRDCKLKSIDHIKSLLDLDSSYDCLDIKNDDCSTFTNTLRYNQKIIITFKSTNDSSVDDSDTEDSIKYKVYLLVCGYNGKIMSFNISKN